jgi:hypothetical protein
MDRERFEQLLAAYGADIRRWPEDERAGAEALAAAHADDLAAALAEARALDDALDLAREPAADAPLLAKRVLRSAPHPQLWALDRRAAVALAACAAFGVVIGYGGGLLAPPTDRDDAYFAMVFEAFGAEDEG